MNLNGSQNAVRTVAKKIVAFDGALELWFLPKKPALQRVIYNRVYRNSDLPFEEYDALADRYNELLLSGDDNHLDEIQSINLRLNQMIVMYGGGR